MNAARAILLSCLLLAPMAEAAPLAIGETFAIDSKVLGETRRINVYTPTWYGEPIDAPLPVLYMPDGGIHEDFLHIAGLVQISVANGTMRPFLLVGIENTERRRDLTGPTDVATDREIAPRVGGSKAFREFIRTELMPTVRARYRVTDETAVTGESLAGLFAIETFFVEPQLFDTYIAIDPSLWWNGESLVTNAASLLRKRTPDAALYIATSDESGIVEPVGKLVAALRENAGEELRWHYQPMPDEQHATIHHPAAMQAFRRMLAPQDHE